MKLQTVNNNVVNRVCNRGDWEFAFSASQGAIGGILCCLYKSLVELVDCVSEQRFIVAKG